MAENIKKKNLPAFALLEVLIASVIAAASFVFALAAIDYNNRQSAVYNLYSTVIESGSEFNDLFVLQAHRGSSNTALSVSIQGSSSASCGSFNQLYSGSAAAALCRGLSHSIDTSTGSLMSQLSVTYGSTMLWGQAAQTVTVVNDLPSTSQTRSSRLLIPWGN